MVEFNDRRPYRGGHQPTPPDEDVGTGHNLTVNTPPDVYDKPHWYGATKGVSDETVRQVRAARGKPDHPIDIYRAAPPHVEHINPGDWVTPSRKYAEQHAAQTDNPAEDWPILHARVPAKHLSWPADSIDEFGYFGPTSHKGR